MNKIILIGNLTRDPETRTTPSGHSVCNFDIAVNDRRGGQENTLYFRIAAWDRTGESCQRFLSKGRKVFVSGPLSYRTYQANDGTTRVSLEVNANDVEFLSSRNDDQAGGYTAPAAPAPMAQSSGFTAVETDELPF
ncbi:MAG: single-stranded DNA-binding protein [Clostridiales bacterium]|nr:single-stranded DNA-binding protein [Clostridiales bacterium]